jgi:AcrR family transcriptional regulator
MGSVCPQRERLIDAMIESTWRLGYVATTISEVTAVSRLSRSSFYEDFRNKEHCFLAAQSGLSAMLQAEVAGAVSAEPPERALRASLRSLIAFAAREPRGFHLLTHEAMIAGPRALDARDEMMLALEGIVERALAERSDEGDLADIPTRLVLGGAVRLLGISMRRAGGAPEAAIESLPCWLECYAAPAAEMRWREMTSAASDLDLALERPVRPSPPLPLPRGRHRLSAEEVRSVRRERILYATAAAVCASGYQAVTVADIASVAGVSREAFYTSFKDKQDAFLHTQRFVFEQMVAASAGAFFTSPKPWPERIWDSLRTTTAWVIDQPVLAHFDFIETYTLGPGDAQRVDEYVLAFNLFLEEGYRYRPDAAALPRMYAEAIAGAVLELCAFYIRHGREAELPRLLPLVAYMILAPFTGAKQAVDLIDGLVASSARPRQESLSL